MSAQRSTMVDWDLAVTTATRMAGPGPTVARSTAEEAVEELRAGSLRSTPLVREFTGLMAPQGAPPGTERTAPVLVVDRQGWIQANVDGFATIVSPLIDRLQEKKGSPGPIAEAIGSRVTGVELGALLGFMSSRVLGQFDPFYAPEGSPGQPAPAGRMLLVAPNVVHVEGELGVDPTDFRLWVCLHEETHRVQFTAVPWMRDHIHEEIGNLIGSVEMDSARLVGMFGEGVKRLSDLVRGDDDVSLLDLVHTPEQKVVLDRITAVMSLLEGHADVVMDGVGPEVIPSVAEIRRKFNVRRKGAGSFDRILRKLLGLDAKMAQYRNGAAFVRGAVDRVGMEGFNKVWVVPENLPSKAEIGDPDSWVRRVHG
ncbi:MAG TPA: zinc-dependent metalloprotease [Nocardioidaceae bacterium]|nr:zinc-dependent metalloprotease [Nocardioidaceae bacterium]